MNSPLVPAQLSGRQSTYGRVQDVEGEGVVFGEVDKVGYKILVIDQGGMTPGGPHDGVAQGGADAELGGAPQGLELEILDGRGDGNGNEQPLARHEGDIDPKARGATSDRAIADDAGRGGVRNSLADEVRGVGDGGHLIRVPPACRRHDAIAGDLRFV